MQLKVKNHALLQIFQSYPTDRTGVSAGLILAPGAYVHHTQSKPLGTLSMDKMQQYVSHSC